MKELSLTRELLLSVIIAILAIAASIGALWLIPPTETKETTKNVEKNNNFYATVESINPLTVKVRTNDAYVVSLITITNVEQKGYQPQKNDLVEVQQKTYGAGYDAGNYYVISKKVNINPMVKLAFKKTLSFLLKRSDRGMFDSLPKPPTGPDYHGGYE